MQTEKWGGQFSKLFSCYRRKYTKVSIKLGEIQRFNSLFSYGLYQEGMR